MLTEFCKIFSPESYSSSSNTIIWYSPSSTKSIGFLKFSLKVNLPKLISDGNRTTEMTDAVFYLDMNCTLAQW